MNKRDLFQNNTARLGATFLPTTTPILMYGVLLFFFGIALYLCGVAIAWIDPNRGRQVLAIGQAETAHERTATGARQ